MPRLIIEHNLHGIDIDPRCAQIAGLSLWLRAQKAWQRLGLKPAERPAIKRSNIVCAEPMPGEKELLREFVEREFPAAERAVCLRLLETIFDKMQLAGEAGSLLKIEEEIRSAIEEARRQATTPRLFDTDVRSLTSEDFWARIEERIYAALRDYAEQAENGGGFQRRLFAEDAARGFAFIDVCRKRYDVVLMNPPFGQATGDYYEEMRKQYPGAHHDIFAAFVRRGVQLAGRGRVGAITSRSFIVAPRLVDFRIQDVLPRIALLCDFGLGVMDDAFVESAAYVLDNIHPSQFSAYDLRKAAPNHSPDAVLNALGGSCHVCVPSHFISLPKARLLYSLPERVRFLMHDGSPFEPTVGTAREGMKSFDNDRYLRLWWEVYPGEIDIGKYWVRMAKGGSFSQYYGVFPLILNWRKDGAELLETNRHINGSTAQVRQASDYWYRPGLTYSKRSSRGFSARVLPSGFVFTSNGPAILPIVGSVWSPLFLLAWINSKFIRGLIHIQSNASDYSSGSIKKLPWPTDLTLENVAFAENNVLELVRRRRAVLALSEVASIFNGCTTPDQEKQSSVIVDEEESVIVSQIDNVVQNSYGVSEMTWADELLTSEEEVESDSEEDDAQDPSASSPQADTISFAVGTTFGRWDIRYGTGEQAAPELPDPFAPLPVCPPGQLQNAQGLPARPEDVPAAYPVRIPWDGILVDDPNHPLDLERRVREVIEIIWSGQEGGPTAEAIEHEACEILGVKSLRDYFRKPAGFFADHLKRYSKSRRQAPIYWPLGTPSGSYTLWIYYHRLTDQTLFTAINDFIEPKLKQISLDSSRLRGKANRSTADDKSLEELIDLEMELKELSDEILRIAGFWKPNLNDGVLITAAPLWRLFKLKPWQKKLKETWEELDAGDYDWAHMALTIAPDRVRLKCKTDKSIAIAHGLENLYVDLVGAIAKRKPRKKKGSEPMLGDEID